MCFEGLHRKFLNSKFYQSNICQNVNISKIFLDKTIQKNNLFYDYNNNNKTQISSISGVTKRKKYKIKDNINFKKKNFIYLYKMLNDYDLGVDNNKSTPILERYKIDKLPYKKIYKGNYHKSTSWITTTTQWYKTNTKGAKGWGGIQSYRSDDDLTKLSYSELKKDSQAVLDGNGDGIVIFRWGLSQILNFLSL